MRMWKSGVLAVLALGILAAPAVQSDERHTATALGQAGQPPVTITLVRWPFT